MARNKYAVARRSVWYVLRTLIVIAAVVVLCIGVFVGAMNVSNLYILTTEGMELRAECILQDGPLLDLTEYFTQEFIDNDAELYLEKYADFTVSAYDYRINVESVNALPWNTRATMQITDNLASISATQNDASEGAEILALPEWTPRRYTVSFAKEGVRWYISGITVIEQNPVEEAKPTPNLSLLTPTPEQ